MNMIHEGMEPFSQKEKNVQVESNDPFGLRGEGRDVWIKGGREESRVKLVENRRIFVNIHSSCHISLWSPFSSQRVFYLNKFSSQKVFFYLSKRSKRGI